MENSISCLLHEMAHAATTCYHGMPWKREMIRLREAGAPLVSADLSVELTDWDGAEVSMGEREARHHASRSR
jgi:hypothetical protein